MPLNGAAAARLYDDHVDPVHALIARRVGADRAADVTGEAFEHAVRSWEGFDPDGGSERLFLFGAATAALRRHTDVEAAHLRSLRPVSTPGSIVDDPLVARPDRKVRVVDHDRNRDIIQQAANDSDLSDTAAVRIMHAIAELAPDDRDIVLLSTWESCSQRDIAQAMDLSVGTVRSALGRIRRELKIASEASTT